MLTLTRNEALALVMGADWGGLVRLYKHWIGHDDHGCTDEDALEAILYDYVAECCDADEVRANGPHGTDDTGLTDPDAEQPAPDYGRANTHAALSEALKFWCAAEGLPVMSADDLLNGIGTRERLTGPQRVWLRAFIHLWDATG